MLSNGKQRILPAALLTLAAAQVAQAAVDYDISSSPTAVITGGFSSISLSKVTSDGVLVGTEKSSSVVTVGTTTTTTETTAVWVRDLSGKQVVIGLGLNSDGTLNTSATSPSDYLYYNSYVNSSGVTVVSQNATNNLVAVSNSGHAVGNIGRYLNTYYYQPDKRYNLGQDAWLYVPGASDAGSTAGSTTVVAPTIISLTGTLADSNGVVSSYFYTPLKDYGLNPEVSFYSSSAIAVSDAGKVLGTSTRYTGLAYDGANTNPSLGTDTWIYTPAHTDSQGQPVAASHKLLGLGISNTGSADSYYSYTTTLNNTSYVGRTSTGVAINSNGWAIGHSTRYASAISSSTRGQDAWVYNGSQTYQVGIVGSYIPNSPATPATYTKSDGTRSTSVVAINSKNQIAGRTTQYTVGTYYLADGVTTAKEDSSFQEAWIYYAPATGVGGTATSYTTPVAGVTPSTGSYIRVGLMDSVSTGSATSMGHMASWGGNTIINYLNNAGQAAGTSTRYLTGDLVVREASRGSDAWYYDGKGTTINITPIVTSTTGGVSYNDSGVRVVGAGKSNYVSSAIHTYVSSSLKAGTTTNSYYATSSIIAMNANGWVAGTSQRYNGASSAGTDSWVYDSTDNVLFVLTAPQVTSAADTGNIYIKALSDTGLALGYYTGANSLQYLFTWTEDDGLQTLSALSGLTNALADDTGWSSLLNSVLLADANGTLYGVGTSTVTNVSGVWSINGTAAVPEPASLGRIGLGVVMLLRRRRKHA